MANSKGNVYPYIIISNDSQIVGYDSQQKKHSLSEPDFAMDIGISEDGTLWAISTSPDPDGGGARIFWSNGDGNWNEIDTSDPGGIRISGGAGSSCYYLTSEGVIRTLDTNGSSSVYDSSHNFLFFDYGGGYVWSLFSPNDGKVPQLYYSPANALSWKAFSGAPQPTSISVDYAGDCYSVIDGNPMVYSKDGSSSYSAGAGANGKSLQISCKNWTYLATNSLDEDGNLIYIWVDEQGGIFKGISTRANKVLSTFYMSS